MSSVEIRERLATVLADDLVGPMDPHEVLNTVPSRWYLTGFLVPTDAPEDFRLDATAMEGLSAEVDADEGEDDGTSDTTTRRPYLPSSMGLSFLVPPGTRAVEATLTWGEYEQLSEAETLALRDAHPDPDEAERAPPDPEAEPARVRFRFWRRTGDRSAKLTVQVRNHDKALPIPGAPGVFLRVVDRPVDGHELTPGTRAVSLFVVNWRPPVEGAQDEACLFQVKLSVTCAKGFAPRRRHGEAQHPDDARADVQFRDQVEWAVGHGVAVEAHAPGGRCGQVQTTWLPRATVHRMKARDLDGVVLSMTALGKATSAADLAGPMDALVREYGAWITREAAKAEALDEARRPVARAMVADARTALARIQEGVALLALDAQVFEAFKLANQAMAAAALKARPDRNPPEWRLFQLAFILLNLAGATQADHADRERVELLFFPTGGGKTEAYLGLAAIVILLRRLRGAGRPDRGAGVTVLLRYTLRLLTLDQLRRAAQLVCALELLRREQPARLGADRFTIGLWVGRKASANRLKDLKDTLRSLRDHGKVLRGPPPVPVTACPWCATPLAAGCFELRPDAVHPHALIVACADESCPFSNEGSKAYVPDNRWGIPIVAVDEHVYRELPTILVGTVDKFASLPWRGETGMLFGRVRAHGTAGFYGVHEQPPKDSTPILQGLLPPELVLQDELHLISGPLGTMVGLYETAVDALCRDAQGRGPKIIASTATARRAAEQIQALFARSDVRLFPPQGTDESDTFFAERDDAVDKTRLYVGVAAPGRSMKLLISRVYAALLGAAQREWSAAGPPGKDNPADTYMTLVAYFNALKELGGAQRLVLEEVKPRLRKMAHRGPVEGARGARFANRVIDFDVLELTSRQSTDDIARAVTALSRPFRAPGTAPTDVLLASSMISVGVDISRLGLMVMNGQPRTVAEYIQATSRVGRETPGLVVTVHNLAKPRDRSHYERFTSFHGSFYRDVEAASVTPFSARAVDRGLAGLVVSLTRHLVPGMAGSTDAQKVRAKSTIAAAVADRLVARATAHRPASDPMPAAVLARLRERVDVLVAAWSQIVEHRVSEGTSIKYSSWEEPRSARSLLSTAVDDLVGEDAALLDQFRAPTSMRDVEPSVHIWVDEKKAEGKR